MKNLYTLVSLVLTYLLYSCAGSEISNKTSPNKNEELKDSLSTSLDSVEEMIVSDSFQSDFSQNKSISLNSTFHLAIQEMNNIFNYKKNNLTIEMFQQNDNSLDYLKNYPDGDDERYDQERNKLDDTYGTGIPVIIRINNHFLSIKCGDEIGIKIHDIVGNKMPEILLKIHSSYMVNCDSENYVINIMEGASFILHDMGSHVNVIEEKGEINFIAENKTTEQRGRNEPFEYSYPKGEHQILVHIQQKWADEDYRCYDLIQLVDYNPKIGYSFGEVKKKAFVGCACCFPGEMLVSINEKEKKLISNLKVGDQVLTYDFVSGQNKISQIEGIISVPHDVYIEYHFDHDSITSTLDHPFYVCDKGWSSYYPEATSSRYNNYNAVDKIAIGDVFKLSNGKKTSLIGYSIIEESRPSYTITKLSDGYSFFVNDILVGVENFDQHCLNKK